MTSPTSSTSTDAAWVARLERRLSKLADTASKESIQALAKWMGFRRTHSQAFAESLAKAIAEAADNSARQWLYLQILHESIVLDSGTSRWDRLQESREVLGEAGMLSVAKKNCLDKETIKKVEGCLKQWDQLNVFGGPTVISLIKKQFANESAAANAAANAAAAASSEPVRPKSPTRPKSPKRERSRSPTPKSKKAAAAPPPEIDTPKEEKKEKKKPEEMDVDSSAKKPALKPSESSGSLNLKSPKKPVEIDFESMNIPSGRVDAKEFLAPCKAIATLQIARDLRNDNAVTVSSLLQSMPEELNQLCETADKEVKETGQPYELKEPKARELSVKTSERVLDMDIDEQLQNVRTFIEVVEKQREARQRLIYLLVRSRCQFGSTETAKTYYELEKMQEDLQKRKDTLMDAMELEGLDFVEEEPADDKAKKSHKKELGPLTWYLNEKKDGPPAAKKQKV